MEYKLYIAQRRCNSVLAITDTKLYVLIVTLSAEDNVKSTKLLGEEFKRPIYWNQYKVIPNKTYDGNGYIRELLDSSYQDVKKLFVLAYDNANGTTPNSHKRYFLPRIKIKNYNIEIDGRHFYDQPINESIKQYDEEKYQQDKVMITQLVVYQILPIFLKNYKLIAADLSKKKALDADSKTIQQIIFIGTANAAVIIYYILQQSKETILEFSKGTTKIF